jgi:hypothetical protein
MPLKHQHKSQGKRWLGGAKNLYTRVLRTHHIQIFLASACTLYVSAGVLLKFIQRAFIYIPSTSYRPEKFSDF